MERTPEQLERLAVARRMFHDLCDAKELGDQVETAARLDHGKNLATYPENAAHLASLITITMKTASAAADAHTLAVSMGLPKLLALPRVDIPADHWEDASDENDRSRLTASVSICGVPMHVEALEATLDEKSCIQEFSGSQGDMADDVYEAVGANGQWQTAEIEGRQYAIIITPYCN